MISAVWKQNAVQSINSYKVSNPFSNRSVSQKYFETCFTMDLQYVCLTEALC